MDRETKFRGLTKEGKWVYGSFINFGANDKYICTSKHGYSYCRNGSKSYIHIKDCQKVLPETVGQFTGLKDKNGKGDDINQNDILISSFNHYRYHIYWDSEYGQWWSRAIEKADKNYFDRPLCELLDKMYMEIIGDIHQENEEKVEE